MKSFIMTSDKGLSYSAGIWRKPLVLVFKTKLMK
jgi:ureidoglycolate hydrolase